MRLKLIHSVDAPQALQPHRRPLEDVKLARWIALGFFILKFPMCFIPLEGSELQELSAYLRVGNGEIPYQDFNWLHGPLAPLVYGLFLKFLPSVLLSVRWISLCIWSGGAYYCARLLSRYLPTRGVLVGTGIATALISYPTFSHSHVLAAVGLLVSAYYFLSFLDEKDPSELFFSFVACLVTFYTRPLLFGYGAMAVWWTLFAVTPGPTNKPRLGLLFALLGLSLGGLFLLLCGSGMFQAFLWPGWFHFSPEGYPNLRALWPAFSVSSSLAYNLSLLHGALETFVFYFFFFIWPTLIFTKNTVSPFDLRARAAGVCTLFALSGALDVLHSGNANMANLTFTHRAEFFFLPSAIGIFLFFWPLATSSEIPRRQRWISGALLTSLTLWGYSPYLSGAYQAWTYSKNPADLWNLSGIPLKGSELYKVEAVNFLKANCAGEDNLALESPDPFFQGAIGCNNIFSRDPFIFLREPDYLLGKGESVYAPWGGITNARLVSSRVQSLKPRFVLRPSKFKHDPPCSFSHWRTEEFGSGESASVICWQESTSITKNE